MSSGAGRANKALAPPAPADGCGHASARREPARDLGPGLSQRGRPHEQPEMGASRDLRADLTLLAANEMFGGEQLFGSDDLVVAGGEQENRSSHHRKIDDRSEGHRSELQSVR